MNSGKNGCFSCFWGKMTEQNHCTKRDKILYYPLKLGRYFSGNHSFKEPQVYYRKRAGLAQTVGLLADIILQRIGMSSKWGVLQANI
jgi:hypothetical protein